MRLPVLLNSNFQIQDQDGLILAKDVQVEFGEKVVSLVNEESLGDLVRNLEPVVLVEKTEVLADGDVLHTPKTSGNGHLTSDVLHEAIVNGNGTATEVSVRIPEEQKTKAQLTSERMKEYWRKRKELAKA